MDAVSDFASLVWPASGIALAALLMHGRALWPAVFIGAWIANVSAGASLLAACAIALGNTLEAVIGVTALQKTRWLGVERFEHTLSRLRDVWKFTLIAAVSSTTVAATLGVASLWWDGAVTTRTLWFTWRAWWVGDALGILVVAPLILVWTARPSFPLSTRRWAEAGCLFVALVLVNLAIFLGLVPVDRAGLFQQAYLVFPFLMWAATRFHQHGAASAAFISSIVAISATALGRGPFAHVELSDGLLLLQGFMGVVTVATLALASAVAERDRTMLALEIRQREAQDAIAVRDDFLAVAGHELKTPLTALLLQVQGLQRLVVKDAALPALSERMTKILMSGRQLEKLIDQLLDVSRVSAGKFVVERERIDLGVLVSEVVSRFREAATDAKCDLGVSIEPEVYGYWDALRLDQVVSNLLANAIKYGRGKPIMVEVSSGDNQAILRVIDRGIGIPDDQKEAIFGRFGRAVSARKFGGLGLGLWISRQIVSALNGKIGVDTKVGEPTTFWVTLPTV